MILKTSIIVLTLLGPSPLFYVTCVYICHHSTSIFLLCPIATNLHSSKTPLLPYLITTLCITTLTHYPIDPLLPNPLLLYPLLPCPLLPCSITPLFHHFPALLKPSRIALPYIIALPNYAPFTPTTAYRPHQLADLNSASKQSDDRPGSISEVKDDFSILMQ